MQFELIEDEDLPKSIVNELSKFEQVLNLVSDLELKQPCASAIVQSYGERLNAYLFKHYLDKNTKLQSVIIFPEEFIITKGSPLHSKILLDKTFIPGLELIRKHELENDVIIVPGYYGISEEGQISLLGRSGTDYTASVLGYILNSEKIIIWKDVDGFMTADPKTIPNSTIIESLSYDEASELAHFGAYIIHPRSILTAKLKGIPIEIRNFNDSSRFTSIHKYEEIVDYVVKSITYRNNLRILRVHVVDGGGSPGIVAIIALELSKIHVNVISISTSHTSVSFLIDTEVESKFYDSVSSLDFVDRIEIEKEMALICVVGEGLGSTFGVASKVFKSIAREKINVQLISAGASKVAYHFTVQEKDLYRAVNLIHNEFFALEVMV